MFTYIPLFAPSSIALSHFTLVCLCTQDTAKWPATTVKDVVYRNPSEFWGTQAVFLSAEVKAEFRSYIEYEVWRARARVWQRERVRCLGHHLSVR